MKSIIALTDFEMILPSLMMNQQDVLDHTAKAHGGGDASTLIKRYGIKPNKIAHRGFENIHIAAEGKDILERTLFFGHRGRDVLQRFYQNQTLPPDHLIHVTCTGYISPSPAQHLVNDKLWAKKTKVTHAYHMGCYASLPAVRMAEGFVAARDQRVDIVHTEMCGLHLDIKDHSPEQLVVQSLFADGHIKYSAVPEENAKTGFRVLNVREQIVQDSQDDMSWVPASWGMKMSLSREVPVKISSILRAFVQTLIQESPYALADVLKNAVFAVHPGGPKIIDAVRETLELSEEQVQTSRDVLLTRGNMSSATLPHVWQKLIQQNIPSKKHVVSLAFGPGLTIFGALFETI